MEEYVNNKVISTGIYDHIIVPSKHEPRWELFQKSIKNYYVVSQKLFDIYSNIDDLNKPLCTCSDGVDLKLFTVRDPTKYYPENIRARPIKIGWAGNSGWGRNDHKGLHTIIKPVIIKLMADGYDIQLEIADRNILWRTQEDMPDFYHTIDIFVCASFSEGTPNPVLEAMACGLVVVSTDVGIVPEAFGELQQAYIVDRTVIAFYNKIKQLLDNVDLLEALSRENLVSIRNWDWQIKAQNFIEYFKKISALRCSDGE